MSLLDDLDKDFAPAWRPEPGDKIAGTVTELTARDGDYGRYPIVTLRVNEGGFNGEVAIHAFREVLENELARVAPKVGDQIAVKYVGPPTAERGYHLYRVRSETEAAFDWSKFGDDDDTDGAADMLRSEVPADTAGLGEPERSTSEPKSIGERAAEHQTDDDIPF